MTKRKLDRYQIRFDQEVFVDLFSGAVALPGVLRTPRQCRCSLRMLTPRELYNAMGFPPDYIIDVDWQGNVYSKSKQVARCGNAVCPPMAKAMVRANLPEYCIVDVSTLAEFCRLVSVGGV